jgi:Putative auto-transporter adhesin, head GIN domain
MAYARLFTAVLAIAVLATVVLAFSLVSTTSLRAEVIEKPIAVGAFEEVHTTGAFDIVIAVGKPRKIIARGDADAVNRLRVDVDNGKLKLWQAYDTKRDYKQPARLKVTLNVEKLTSLKLTGAGDVSAYNIAAKKFALTMSGAGDVKLVGTCDSLTVFMSGAGDFDGDVLKCKTVSANVSGVGDMAIYASDSITGSVSGVGDLTIYGNPRTRSTKVSGMGDVNFR